MKTVQLPLDDQSNYCEGDITYLLNKSEYIFAELNFFSYCQKGNYCKDKIKIQFGAYCGTVLLSPWTRFD